MDGIRKNVLKKSDYAIDGARPNVTLSVRPIFHPPTVSEGKGWERRVSGEGVSVRSDPGTGHR